MAVLAGAATAVFAGEVTARAAAVQQARCGTSVAFEAAARANVNYSLSSEAVADADGLFDARTGLVASALADAGLDGAGPGEAFPGFIAAADDPVGGIVVDFDLQLSSLGSLIVPLEFDGGTTGGSEAVIAPPGTVTTHTGDYTCVIGDAGDLLEMDSASPLTLTIPTHAAAPFALLDQINVSQSGDGALTIAAAAGVTLYLPEGLLAVTRAKGAMATLVNVAVDEWRLAGDLLADGAPTAPADDFVSTFEAALS